MAWVHTVGGTRYVFDDLKTLLARATPEKSGDQLAGIAARSAAERVAARWALADLPLAHFLRDAVVPYEHDEVTRLIVDTHDAAAFAPVAHLTVGGFRDWLLSDAADSATLAALAPGLTPEMVAATSKLMRHQDLMLVAAKCHVVTRFRNTIGLPGLEAVLLQPGAQSQHVQRRVHGIARQRVRLGEAQPLGGGQAGTGTAESDARHRVRAQAAPGVGHVTHPRALQRGADRSASSACRAGAGSSRPSGAVMPTRASQASNSGARGRPSSARSAAASWKLVLW